MERSDLKSRSAALRILLVVTAQSAITPPASKQLLDQPPFALHTKTLLSWLLDSNVQRPSKLFLHLRFKLRPSKAFISPDKSDALTPRSGLDFLKQQQRSGTLSGVGGYHNAFEPVAACVTQRHALAPAQLLGPIVSTRPSTQRVPGSVLFTLCESTLAAVGKALRR